MVDPPIDESFVGNDVETLFGRRGLGECIGNIGTKNQKVLSRQNRVEDPTASLINTVGICLIENSGLARTRKSVTCASCFIPTAHSFVGNNVETLFGRRGLGECIGNIGTKNQKVLSRRNRVGDPTSSLINTVGICLVKNSGLARTRRSVTCQTEFEL